MARRWKQEGGGDLEGKQEDQVSVRGGIREPAGCGMHVTIVCLWIQTHDGGARELAGCGRHVTAGCVRTLDVVVLFDKEDVVEGWTEYGGRGRGVMYWCRQIRDAR